MEHMKRDRLLPFLMAAAMIFTLLALPARASQFSDITDPEVTQAADVLSALGVVNGTGGGRFNPDGQLTRAQFCKMVIEIMGRGGLADGQKYRTIFKDAKAPYWATGYVNLAATMDLGDGVYLMQGTGNGNFAPERPIRYQEAATTLLRVLGYGQEAERYWPDGAIQTAASLGLDKGLNIKNPAGAINRGQAALLFYRLLGICPKGSDQTFLQIQDLGRQVDNVIVLSVTGQNGAQTLVTTEGEYPATVPVDPALAGQRGSLLLDGQGRFIAMLSGETSTVSFTVGRHQNGYLYNDGGTRYAIPSDARVYTDMTGDSDSYGSYRENIRTGDAVTLYLDAKGQVVCLLHRKVAVLNSFVIVRGTASASMFASLTGTERSYTILKNGRPASMSDISDYDVATYDPVSKVLYVCDVRLRCVYESASPSPTAPTGHIVAAGGHEFTVLDDAVNAFADQRIGNSIILMLTYDGNVAGLYPTHGGDSNNTIGVLDGDTFKLLNCKLELDASSVTGSRDRLFSATSNRRDTLTLTPVTTQSGGTFKPSAMTLDRFTVVSSPAVYERTGGGLRAVELSDVPEAASVSQYHRNSAGQVDIIILAAFSGDGVAYGRIDFATGYVLGEENASGLLTRSRSQYMWFSTADGGTVSLDTSGILAASGCFGSFTASQRFNGGQVVSSVQPLEAVAGVSSSAFYTADGKTYVRTTQGVFQVADDVQCCNLTAYTAPITAPAHWYAGWTDDVWSGGGDDWAWESFFAPGQPSVTWFEDLTACRNYSDTLTIYLDSLGQKVRIISVQ